MSCCCVNAFACMFMRCSVTVMIPKIFRKAREKENENEKDNEVD